MWRVSFIADDAKDDREAIDLGIGFEKDSIAFYKGMKKLSLGSNQQVIGSLIIQEQNHLKKLFDLKKELV